MTGVNYASGKVLGTTNAGNVQASLTTGDDSTVQPTAISSSYVATDVSDIVDEVMPSIVAITNVSQTEYQSFWGQSKTYESTSCGSGIIVSQDKEYLYVATNNHVVEGANSLTVTFANDDTVSAEIKGTDPSTDLAVVKVALSSIKDDTMSAIKVATLGSSDTLKVGESCIAIGNALGYGQSVTTGVISALNREVSVSDSSSSTNYTAELIQTDAAINPGNSGGALLNTAGEVIGINSVKYSDTSVEGIGYAIPVDTAKPIIEELITKEKVDDPNYTIESILNRIDDGPEFKGVSSWDDLKEQLKEFGTKGNGKSSASGILFQSWQRFRRLINNSINDDVFVNAKSMSNDLHQVYLSDEILNMNGGEMRVVDIAGLTEQLQCLVFGDIIRSVYALKHGDYEQKERSSKKPVPKKIIIFVDELNKYAPSNSRKNSPLLSNLLDITERGRSEGVILFSAEQFRSAIHERIKGNCGTNVYGRTNAIEVSRPDYKFVPTVYANMMTRLKKGDLILHHPVFKTLLKIQFPFPSYNQGGSE